MLRVRPTAAGVLAATAALGLAACGSDAPTDGASATQAGASTAPTTASFAPPGQQAKTLIVTTIPLPVWTARLAEEWGAKPKLEWSATKQTDTRWLGRLVISGPKDGQRMVGEWTIPFPLDRAPTKAETAGFDLREGLPAANATARKLAGFPPVAKGTDDVTLPAVAVPLDTSGSNLDIDLDGAADRLGADVVVDGKLDEPALRGRVLEQGKNLSKAASVSLKGAKLLGADGHKLSRKAFLAQVQPGSPQPITITWRSVPQSVTLRPLLKRTPATIQIVGAGGASPTSPTG